MVGKIAEVCVDLAVETIDRVFHYSLEDDRQIALGQAVQVPFGRQKVRGIVVGFCDHSPFPNLKAIDRVLFAGEVLFSAEQLHLARLLASHYFCPLSLILRQMLPFRLSAPWPKPRVRRVIRPLVDSMPAALPTRAHRQRQILAELLQKGEISGAEIGSPAAVRQLIEKGYADEFIEESPSQALVGCTDVLDPIPTLTKEQEAAVEELGAALKSFEPSVWLLHGVTGSGKTEVYLRLFAEALQQGKQCLMLVPEISLTPQMVSRFQARFGTGIALWHSGLTARERYDEWRRIKNGQAQVVIGARSAIFAPLERLGVIVLDEEHDQSYQQDENPRYHTRVVAQLRQETSGCLLLLGSATPALETYRATEKGRCRLLQLKSRVSARVLPPVRIVDMRAELRAGHRGLLSRRLQHALEVCLARDEQAIILLNRRGFASFMICPDCGHVPFCSRCDISLTYHLSSKSLLCHYCGQRQAVMNSCPNCGSKRLRTQGIGTERLQEELKVLFPQAVIGRMDRDTTMSRGSHARILDGFGQGNYDILIGTQMIAKGLDFPRVTLVGVVGADMGLYAPDFRASERTFQLLTQVAGRAGRGDTPGEVVLQAFDTQHFALLAAKDHDYRGFYKKEMQARNRGAYPPLGYMITLFFTGLKEEDLVADAAWMAELLRGGLDGVGDLIGPAPCLVSKVKDRFRWQIIVKSRLRSKLRAAVKAALASYYAANRTTSIILEFDA